MDTYSVAVFIRKRVHTGLAGADDPVVRYTTAMPLSTQMGTVFSQSVGGHKPPAAPLRDQFPVVASHHVCATVAAIGICSDGRCCAAANYPNIGRCRLGQALC